MDDLEQFEHLRRDAPGAALWEQLLGAFRSPPPAPLPPPFVDDVSLLFEQLADGWVEET